MSGWSRVKGGTKIFGLNADRLVETLARVVQQAEVTITNVVPLLLGGNEVIRLPSDGIVGVHHLVFGRDHEEGIGLYVRCAKEREIAVREMKKQTEAMSDAARVVINKEVAPPLRQLAATLTDLVNRSNRAWWPG